MKFYISGGITGVPHYLETFKEVENYLVMQGIEVVNPTTLKHDHDKSYEAYMKEDIKELLLCDAIFMISGWGKSLGAVFEHEVAKTCGIKTLYENFCRKDISARV